MMEYDFEDIYPQKNIQTLSDDDLKMGIFYIERRQLIDFKELYGEGEYQPTMNIYYGD
jgi:hypothetical protein